MDKFFCCHCIRMKEISISCEGQEDFNVAIGFALTLLVCSLFLAFNYPNRLVTNPMDHRQSWFPSVFRDSSRSRSFFKFIFPDSDSSSDEIYKLVIDNAGEMSDSKENGTRGILNDGFVPLTDNAGIVILDDCNFHEPVRLENFDLDRTLTLVSPDGGFPVMNYRMTREFKPPFRVNALIEEAGSLKAEVMLKVRSDFSSTITANTVVLHMSLPKYTTRVSFDLEPGAVGQTTDFKEGNKMLEWGLRKIVGGSEHTLRAKLTFSQETNMNITKESGPVSMTFTIPMYSASRLQVRYLQIVKKNPEPTILIGGCDM